MDKPNFSGFAILKLSKLLMYKRYYGKLQPYFEQDKIQLHYMDTDSFVLSVNKKDSIKDLKNLEDIFDFSNLDKNHQLFSNKNKKVIGKFKIETPKNIWIDELICLRNKMYVFKCGNDSKNKLKGISKTQNILNLKSITIVHLVENMRKNVKIIFQDQLIMKCIFKKYKNRHYLYSMISDVTQMKLKINLGINHICYLINLCKI